MQVFVTDSDASISPAAGGPRGSGTGRPDRRIAIVPRRPAAETIGASAGLGVARGV